MQQRLTAVTLAVADLACSRRFYEEGLGWLLHWTDDDVAFYQAGGMVFALWRAASLAAEVGIPLERAATPGGFELAHNVRERDEVDVVLAAAESAGAKLLKPASDAFWGGRTGHFADPDGHLWEVAWNPGWPMAEDGSVRLQT